MRLTAWAETVFTLSRPKTKKPARAGFLRSPGGRLDRLADQVLTHTGFHVVRGRGWVCERIRRGLQLRADLAGRRVAVVDLRVYRNRDLVRQVRAAYDQAGETQAACADRGVLHADDAPGRVRRRRSASCSRGQARDESGDAQMLPK